MHQFPIKREEKEKEKDESVAFFLRRTRLDFGKSGSDFGFAG